MQWGLHLVAGCKPSYSQVWGRRHHGCSRLVEEGTKLVGATWTPNEMGGMGLPHEEQRKFRLPQKLGGSSPNRLSEDASLSVDPQLNPLHDPVRDLWVESRLP